MKSGLTIRQGTFSFGLAIRGVHIHIKDDAAVVGEGRF